MLLPVFQPLPLTRRPQPFSHAEWCFELKYDGFRALAYVEGGRVRLVSRNGNEFRSFDAGLVNGRREGRCVYYRVQPRGMKPLIDWIAHYRAFWTEHVGRLEELLEKMDE